MHKLIVFLLNCAVAYSEATATQTPKQVTEGSATTKQTEPDKRGTEASPLVVNQHTIQTKEEAAEEAARDAEQKHVNRWLIGLTIGLVFAAFLQIGGVFLQVKIYVKQTRLMFDGLRVGHMNAQAALIGAQAAKDSADAARKNVQIFADRERAHLIIRPNLQINVPMAKGRSRDISLYVRNLGISRALDVACYASAISGPEAQHPAEWPIVMNRNIIQPTEEDNSHVAALVRLVDGHDIEGLSTETETDPTLFSIEVKGLVTYKDIFRAPHELWFRYQYRVKSACVRTNPLGTERVWFIEDGEWEKAGNEDNRET